MTAIHRQLFGNYTEVQTDISTPTLTEEKEDVEKITIDVGNSAL